jgi:Flp pilus assembly protein TadD
VILKACRASLRWALAAAIALPGALFATAAGVPDELGAEIARRGLDPARILRPMAIDGEMRSWLAGRVPEGPPEERLKALLAALIDSEGLGLRYSSGSTLTASEAFDGRQGNCLSFTHLFVALARELGLDVYYVEVRRTPRFEQDGDLVVVWEHVTAGFGPEGERLLLEFGSAPPVTSQTSRRLSDLTAVAMHYSNRGAELLREGRREEALEWLRTAVALDSAWAHAWVNLGVAKRRSGDLEGAEAAYRRAIEADPRSLQPYFNLAGLLRSRGDRDAAHDLLVLLQRQDSRDPFVPLALGDGYLVEGRLDEARRFYARAVLLAPAAAEPRSAMGLWALEAGHRKRAERALSRARTRSGKGPRYERLLHALTGAESTTGAPPEPRGAR